MRLSLRERNARVDIRKRGLRHQPHQQSPAAISPATTSHSAHGSIGEEFSGRKRKRSAIGDEYDGGGLGGSVEDDESGMQASPGSVTKPRHRRQAVRYSSQASRVFLGCRTPSRNMVCHCGNDGLFQSCPGRESLWPRHPGPEMYPTCVCS